MNEPVYVRRGRWPKPPPVIENLPFYGGMDLLPVRLPVQVVARLHARAEREGQDVDVLAGRILEDAA